MSSQPTENGGGSVNVTQLPLDQLELLRKQLHTDVGSLSAAFESLRSAQNRFSSNHEVLSDYERVCEAARASAEKPQEALVCISSALYATGRIVPSDRVLVDVGTDYFLEKPIGSAKTYFANRVATLRENIESVEQKLQVKQTQLRQVVEIMRQKQAVAQ